MPYKDPDQRRAYDRRYKRERRRRASLYDSRPTEVRAYICQCYPNLRLPGGASFHEGLLVNQRPGHSGGGGAKPRVRPGDISAGPDPVTSVLLGSGHCGPQKV